MKNLQTAVVDGPPSAEYIVGMLRPRSWPLRWLLCLAVPSFVSLTGCPSKEENKTPPPPSPPPPSSVTSAGACASGGGEVKDPVSSAFFPRSVGGGEGSYCLDPQGETKTYGDNAKHPKEEVCTTLFDGECEIYMRYKLSRVVALRYVDGAGKGGTVDVYLSTFADTNGGYGMYTKRVIADSDPADESAPKPLPGAGGGAVMGTGRAYVWKGQYLAELQYNNEQESPEQLTKSSATILPVLAKEIGGRLPGAKDKPASAKALPEGALVSASAIQFEPKEALGIPNSGPLAIGYYREDAKRYRVVAIARDDAEQAKDVMKLVAKRPEALPVAGLADEATHVMIKEGDKKTEYVFARKGALVLGVGDEEFAKANDARLAKDGKIAKLKALFAGSSAPAPSPSASASAPPPADAGKK